MSKSKCCNYKCDECYTSHLSIYKECILDKSGKLDCVLSNDKKLVYWFNYSKSYMESIIYEHLNQFVKMGLNRKYIH